MMEGFWGPRLDRSNHLASFLLVNYITSPGPCHEDVDQRKSGKRVVTDVLVEVSGHG
jgi:hypothetical protein